jgi:hypothetical protein
MERYVHDIRLTVKQSLKKENGAIKYRYIEEEEHLISPPVFSEVRVTRFVVVCVCFVDRCLSFCPFFYANVLSVVTMIFHNGQPSHCGRSTGSISVESP